MVLLLVNQDAARGRAKCPTRCPTGCLVDQLPLDFSVVLRDGLRWNFLKQSYQVFFDLSSLLHWAGQTPGPLSHIFHWDPKWYSMLPIASPFSLSLSLSVFFFIRASSVCCWKIWRKSWNCTVISAQETDRWRFSLGSAHRLTDSRLHLGHFVHQKLNNTDNGWNHMDWNPRMQTIWKSFPIWWGNMTPTACWSN